MTGYQLSESVSTCFGPGFDAGLAVANKGSFVTSIQKTYEFCRASLGFLVHQFQFVQKQKLTNNPCDAYSIEYLIVALQT